MKRRLADVGQRDPVVGAELVVVKYLFGAQQSVAAIRVLQRGVLKAVGELATGPKFEVAHMGA